MTMFGVPKYAPNYAKYAYLGTPNIVKWGVPEKMQKMQFRHVGLLIGQ